MFAYRGFLQSLKLFFFSVRLSAALKQKQGKKRSDKRHSHGQTPRKYARVDKEKTKVIGDIPEQDEEDNFEIAAENADEEQVANEKAKELKKGKFFLFS